MKLYIWRHNRAFHSYSMIEEPVIHNDLYTLAEISVAAHSLEEAIKLVRKEAPDFRAEDLLRLEPEVIEIKLGVLSQRVFG